MVALAKGIQGLQPVSYTHLHMPFTQQDILQTLLALNKKGLLDGTEEGFQAAPEISACFAILQHAKGVLNLMPQVPETVSYTHLLTPTSWHNEEIKNR